jgi:hypothetical protein
MVQLGQQHRHAAELPADHHYGCDGFIKAFDAGGVNTGRPNQLRARVKPVAQETLVLIVAVAVEHAHLRRAAVERARDGSVRVFGKLDAAILIVRAVFRTVALRS